MALNYQFTNYTRGNDYKGFQNTINQVTDWKGWRFNNEFVITNSNSSVNKGVFLRPTIDLSKQFKKMNNWQTGLPVCTGTKYK